MPEGRLEGRVAVITGSGEGIGRAIAQRFAEEGANVLMAEINPDLGEAAAAELGAITETRLGPSRHPREQRMGRRRDRPGGDEAR